jgi:hypothetical protein
MAIAPAPTLRDFLKKYVEDYLLEDLASLDGVQPVAGKATGACGYPLVMTVCSGVELLGGLCSAEKLKFREKGFAQDNFLRYWEEHMYPRDPHLQRAGPGVYALIRNGVAHSFLKKGPIVVFKGFRGGDALTAAPGTPRQVFVNATQLAADFDRSYKAMKAAMTPATERNMEHRLAEIWTEYTDAAWGTTPSAPAEKGKRRNLDFFAELKPPPAFFLDAVSEPTGTDAPTAAPTPPAASPSPTAVAPPQQVGSGQGTIYTSQQPVAPLVTIPTTYKTN